MSLWGTIKGAGLRIGKGRGGANTLQDGAVDLQHGTGVQKMRTFAPTTTTPNKVLFLHLKTNVLIIYNVRRCIYTEYFSSLQVKNKPHEGVMNVRLFLNL
jgi:hypothetical protein